MSNRFLSASAIALLLFSGVSFAQPGEAQIDSIRALGDLNGVALQCRYLEQTRKMKQALIETLPKRQELGQLFDDRSNTAFLAFIESKSACPSPAEFEGKVDSAIESLKQNYASK